MTGIEPWWPLFDPFGLGAAVAPLYSSDHTEPLWRVTKVAVPVPEPKKKTRRLSRKRRLVMQRRRIDRIDRIARRILGEAEPGS